MGMKDTAKGLATTLRLDSHHAIERFGIFFAAILATFVLIFTSAAASSVGNQRAQMDSTTLYTPTFSTSKTQLSGDVSGIYLNSKRTRAMVLMHFKDATSISANAKKYQAFLTGSNRELRDQALKSNIRGQIVVFGSTGYMAMVLDSDTAFQQQILNLTMRANSELVYRPEESRQVREDLAGQKTFTQYDQWRLYFNPGASGTKTATALDAPQFDAGAVYAQLVVNPEEKTLRASMEQQLGQMKVDQARIAEYVGEAGRVNVDDIFLELPDAPRQIAGDTITGDEATDGKPSTLTLKPKWVSPNGYDFDWRDGSVAKGYLDDIVPKDESYVTYLAAKAAASSSDETSRMRVDQLEWKLSDGTVLGNSSDQTMQPLVEIRNGLAQTYQDYYDHKVEYQVKSYASLIELEVNLRNVRVSASENDSEKALFTY